MAEPEQENKPKRLGMTNYGENGEGEEPTQTEGEHTEVTIPEEVWADMSQGLFKATWDKYINTLEMVNANLESMAKELTAAKEALASINERLEALELVMRRKELYGKEGG